MILLELFSGVHQVRVLDTNEIEEMLIATEMAESGDVARAYEMQNGNRRIIIWFTILGSGRYECSFGLKGDNPYDYAYNFNATGTGNEFKVYGAVAQCIREFIHEFQPNVITMVGYTDRQSELYRKATRRVLLPTGYEFDTTRSGGANIVRVEP